MRAARRLLGLERRVWDPNPPLGTLLGPDARSAQAAVHAQARSYDGAKAHAAVFGCVDLLCRIIATMPVDQYVRRGGRRVEVEPSPLLVAPSPQPWMPAAGWRRQVLESWLLRGYAAGLVVAERNGWPTQIEVVHPDQVSWRWVDGLGVEWRLDGRQVGSWWDGSGPLWVAPSLHATPGSPVGASVIQAAAGTVALGLGASKFGGDWFDNAATPSDIYSVDVDTLTRVEADELKRRIKESTANREPIVLTKVIGHHHVSIAPNESQFLETVAANKADVCTYFGVPPESIGASSGDSMTYANVEGRNLGLLTNTVGAWLAWFEASLNRLLPRPQFVKFVPDALLRTSTVTRYTAHEKGLRSGFLTQNEARAMEDLPPSENGDVLLWPPYSSNPSTDEPEPVEGP